MLGTCLYSLGNIHIGGPILEGTSVGGNHEEDSLGTCLLPVGYTHWRIVRGTSVGGITGKIRVFSMGNIRIGASEGNLKLSVLTTCSRVPGYDIAHVCERGTRLGVNGGSRHHGVKSTHTLHTCTRKGHV